MTTLGPVWGFHKANPRRTLCSGCSIWLLTCKSISWHWLACRPVSFERAVQSDQTFLVVLLLRCSGPPPHRLIPKLPSLSCPVHIFSVTFPYPPWSMLGRQWQELIHQPSDWKRPVKFELFLVSISWSSSYLVFFSVLRFFLFRFVLCWLGSDVAVLSLQRTSGWRYGHASMCLIRCRLLLIWQRFLLVSVGMIAWLDSNRCYSGKRNPRQYHRHRNCSDSGCQNVPTLWWSALPRSATLWAGHLDLSKLSWNFGLSHQLQHGSPSKPHPQKFH